MATSKIKPPQSVRIQKYASGPSFCVLHGSWLHQVPFSHFGHKTTYPCRWRNPKIHHSSLHTLKNIHLDQVSASYLAPGSVRIHFRVLAGKQPTPMMVPCNKNKPPQSSSIKNMPMDQVSASYMAPSSVRTRFHVSVTKQTTSIDGAI